MKLGTFVRIGEPSECDGKFAALREHGFDACHLVYKPERYDPSAAAEIARSAAAHGVEVSAVFAGYRDDYTEWDIFFDYAAAGLNTAFAPGRMDYVRSAIEFAARLGTGQVVVHAGFVPNDPFTPAYGRLLSAVARLAKEAKKAGLWLLLETGGESPITLKRLIEDSRADNLAVNLDTGNLIMYGYGNPADAVVTLGGLIRSVHAKDGLPPTDPRRLGAEVPIGEGSVDFAKVLAGLNALGYDGNIIIEREIEGGKQTEDVVRGAAYIKKVLRETGKWNINWAL